MLVRPGDWRPQGVDDLEDRAWEALRETERSVCVTAGAGAGKTEFLAQKAAYLLQTGLCPYPKRILAISFKRDAALNLSKRVRQRCTPEHARRFASYTFDAFTKQMLDRFRMAVPAPYTPSANYRIVFPARGDYQDFFRSAGRPNFDQRKFEGAIANISLPIAEQDIAEAAQQFLQGYWEYQYGDFSEVLLTFPMINRLVKYIIGANPDIRQALRLTYDAVFLDEFQDTTSAQYSLVRTCFEGAGARLTAVGDDKQRIMGWAGAMDRAFDVFTETFNARRISLLSNWRSHEDLVRIQHVIAAQIDPEVEPAQARANRQVDGEVAAIWDFQDRQAEVGQIARWIRAEVDAGRVAPQRASITQRKTAQPVRFEITELTRQSLERWIVSPEMLGADYLWPSRFHESPHLSTRQYARILRGWVTSIGLDPSSYGTHSMRRTKVAQIYKKTGNLRAVQLLLGHTKMDSTIRYLGVELDDALTISEAIDL